MAIEFDNIVGTGSLKDGGYVGKYMQVIRAHLNDAKNKREITSAQAGEIYATTIPAMLKEATAFELSSALSNAQTRGEEAKADSLESQKIIEGYKKQMAEVDRDIALDESYKIAKIAELVSARIIAEANATKAVTDKNIAGEQLSTEKEKNGNVGYEYIYYKKYYDYSGNKHKLEPTYEGDTIDVETTFQVYTDGSGLVRVIRAEETTNVGVVYRYMSYLHNDELVHTKVMVKGNRSFLGLVYILTDVSGASMLVDTTEASLPPQVIVTDGATEELINLQYSDVVAKTKLTEDEWVDLFDAYNQDNTKSKFSTLLFYHREVTRDEPTNPNNFAGFEVSRVGDSSIDGAVETFTYTVSDDINEIHSVVKNTDVVATNPEDGSVVKLEKQKIASAIKVAEAQIALSKLPSGMK